MAWKMSRTKCLDARNDIYGMWTSPPFQDFSYFRRMGMMGSHVDDSSARTSSGPGASGFLLTCERGREVKCEREGLEILRHYLRRSGAVPETNNDIQVPTGGDSEPKALSQNGAVGLGNGGTSESGGLSSSGKSVSLEEELTALRRKNKQSRIKSSTQSISDGMNLVVCETGCKGLVMVLHKRPNTNSSDYSENVKGCDESNATKRKNVRKRKHDKDVTPSPTMSNSQNAVTTTDSSGEPHSKRVKESPSAEDLPCPEKRISNVPDDDETTSSFLESFDPVDIVESIIREASPDFSKSMGKLVSLPPSSRFVTRIIPLQATCVASIEEIESTTRILLRRFFRRDTASAEKKETKTTFGIFVKRRNCSHLSSQKIIEALASNVIAQLAPSWKVNLKDPEVKLWIEVCRTKVGISVFRIFSTSLLRTTGSNFNLAEVRAPTNN